MTSVHVTKHTENIQLHGSGLIGDNNNMNLIYSPSKKRSSVSPAIYLILGSLILYFMWRDVDLYVYLHQCKIEKSNTSSLSDPMITVKHLMQPPTIHYIELPLAEWMEENLSLSKVRITLNRWKKMGKGQEGDKIKIIDSSYMVKVQFLLKSLPLVIYFLILFNLLSKPKHFSTNSNSKPTSKKQWNSEKCHVSARKNG